MQPSGSLLSMRVGRICTMNGDDPRECLFDGSGDGVRSEAQLRSDLLRERRGSDDGERT